MSFSLRPFSRKLRLASTALGLARAKAFICEFMGNATVSGDGVSHLANALRLRAFLACKRFGKPAQKQLGLPVLEHAFERLRVVRHFPSRKNANGGSHALAGIAHGNPHADFPDIESKYTHSLEQHLSG